MILTIIIISHSNNDDDDNNNDGNGSDENRMPQQSATINTTESNKGATMGDSKGAMGSNLPGPRLDPALCEKAEGFRRAGREAYNSNKYEKAIEAYTQGQSIVLLLFLIIITILISCSPLLDRRNDGTNIALV